MSIRDLIDASRMSTYQWVIVALAAFLNMLDGYDLVAMAFTANSVQQEFALSSFQLGWLLSAPLIGVGIGSVTLSPLADRFGRRNIIIAAGLIDFIGLALTTTAGSFAEIFAYRLITGIGVGGILATVTVVTSEFSNLRRRGLAMALYASGYGIGATICGLLAKKFIPLHGWEVVYGVGAALTLIALIATFALLPESTDYLRTKRPAGYQDKILRTAQRIGLDTSRLDLDTHDHQSHAAKAVQEAKRGILSDSYRITTLRLWAAFILIQFVFTFANSWTPKLVAQSGMTPEQGIQAGIAISLGGTIGSIIFGILTANRQARHLLIGVVLLSAIGLAGFVLTISFPVAAFLAGLVAGMLLNGCITGMYTVVPASYGAQERATGMGAAIGVSRLGAVTAPIVAGYLLGHGWQPTWLYYAAAVIIVLAVFGLWGLKTPTDNNSVQEATAHAGNDADVVPTASEITVVQAEEETTATVRS